MKPEAENPEQVNLAFTNKLLTWHFSLLEDHLLELHREPSEQCLSCANWHLEKIKAYNTLERPKFDPQCSQESCHNVTHWANIVQSKLPNMSKEEALKYGKEAREFRYYFAGDVAELPDMHIEEHQQGDGRIRLRDLLTPEISQEISAPFGWPGGKKNLKKEIVKRIPSHKTYVEPFCGAAHVFWEKEPSEIEILNDIDPDLMRFYGALQKGESLGNCDLPKVAQNWGELVDKQGEQNPCEFLANVVCSYGSKREALAQSGSQGRSCHNNAPQFRQRISQYQDRLKEVKLLNEDWEKVIKQYDSFDTFFYLDPPYHETAKSHKYSEDQLERLAKVLPNLKGKWLLSYNDHPDVRQAFKDYHIDEITTRYGIQGGSKEIKNLLISNYQGNGKIKLKDILQETPTTAESQLSYLEMALATQADVFRDWEKRLEKTNPECAKVAREAKELFQEYQQEASLGIGQKEAKMGKYAGEKLRSYQSGGSREGIRLRDILEEQKTVKLGDEELEEKLRRIDPKIGALLSLEGAISFRLDGLRKVLKGKIEDIYYEDLEAIKKDITRMHTIISEILSIMAKGKIRQSQEMPPYERKLQEAEKEALEAVRKAPEDSYMIAIAIEKVAKAKDVDKDELIRRVVTEERVKLTSISPNTYRVILEGKEIGPVLSEEEKEGAATFTRCIMHQFLGQPDWCIRGYEQGKYEVREGQTVEKATGKPVPGCYSPFAICRASVYKEYAEGG